MKLLSVLFLVAAASAASFNKELLKYVKLPKEPKEVTPAGRLLARSFTVCNSSTNLQYRCNSDCTAKEYCLNGRIMSVNCERQTGKKYCDMMNGYECSDTIEQCYNPEDFCPQDGRYPDLTNCRRYVYCHGGIVNPYECEHGMIWNYKTGGCDKDASCRTYTRDAECSDDKMWLMIRHLNPRWFVFCSYDRPLLGECPGIRYSFDEETATCRFQCGVLYPWTRDKKYADEFKPWVYYDCVKVGNKWKSVEKICPSGSWFSEHNQICVSIITTTEWTSTEPPRSDTSEDTSSEEISSEYDDSEYEYDYFPG